MEALKLFYDRVKDQVTSKADSLIILLYHAVISKGMYCVGIGDNWSENLTKIDANELPKDWNSNQKLYTLRFVDVIENRFVMKVHNDHEIKCLYVNFYNVNGNKTVAFPLKISLLTRESWQEFETAFTEEIQKFPVLVDRIKDTLSKTDQEEERTLEDVTKKNETKKTKAFIIDIGNIEIPGLSTSGNENEVSKIKKKDPTKEK
ncbi:uncharacterized protein LOC111635366 [Centruroides sculpturatus]|uniref:uncharacterized protein LOC111635366 n=1 Tax=Centruroides sculpturatus TaxID=218467 RepID=UPI000C6D9744|nr:uncharacterized protein LOC111635366 [Centruroides sculpturatus]